jgi:nucleoside-diphosphate-sugar epimerase
MSELPQAVVVFGASGFIGRNLVDALTGRVETLLGVTRRGAQVPGCDRVVTLDRLADLPALPADSAVVHAAARRYNASTFAQDQSAILDANVAIANAVYRFCEARGIGEVRLASSSAVYPADWAVLDDERVFDLDDWPNTGEAAYAWSKRWDEICAELYRRQRGINTIAFRLSNPYGPHDCTDVAAAHVAAAFVIKALLPGDEFEIRGNPDAERDFMYVGDVTAAFLASLGKRGQSGAYNLASGQTTSVRALAEAALRAAGRTKRIVVGQAAPSGVAVRRLTAARVRRDFDLPPFTDLDRGLPPTMEWYRYELRG